MCGWLYCCCLLLGPATATTPAVYTKEEEQKQKLFSKIIFPNGIRDVVCVQKMKRKEKKKNNVYSKIYI